MLVSLGCEIMQGYLYGRAMRMEEFEDFLSRVLFYSSHRKNT